MNKRVLSTLEFHKIIDDLKGYAGSEPGKLMCEKLCPSYNLEWIVRSQKETADALSRLIKNDRVSFNANKDIRASVKSVEIGRTLSISELLVISRMLVLTNELSEYGQKAHDDDPDDSLTPYFDTLAPLPLLTKEISRCITDNEEIADNASAELSKIRKSYSVIEGRIHSTLNTMVNSTYRSYLMDAVITMRDNRYCLPVKAEYKSQVSGIVHDKSSTGSTYFIEPSGIVNLNNELKDLDIRQQKEIEEILKGLSARVAAQSPVILENQKTITLLDFIFAKAKYALKYNATMPIFNDEHRINLRSARHPLIDQEKVVPISLTLGDDFDLLIVTGPNTGGKTVSLKTVGLLSLMGQSGLHIPALDRSELGLFKEIYADIGDEQSIEQSLSTFSSHMTSIVDIFNHVDQDSLCLFDELGAGTDPTEGAALAISILNYLHDRGIRTMATTHYSELKIYALQTSFVQNACCEFDVESLRPTYRLLIGIPGKSNAFAISSKLGLSDDIIEYAKSTISAEDERFEDVIEELEAKRIRLENDQKEIDDLKAQIASLKEELEGKHEKLSSQRDRILKEAKEEAREILKEAKDMADESIRAFQNQNTVMKIQTMEKKRANLRKKIDENTTAPSLAKQPKADKAKTITLEKALPGTNVHIISMNIDGVITVRPDSRGNVSVQCGIITSKVNIKDLYEIKEDKSATKAPAKKPKLNLSKSSNIPSEINVIGLTVDDAIMKVDKYLDDALLCHMPSVRIVHGKGTGALRNAIHDFLSRCSYVSSYNLGAHGEGDAGVTIVHF